MAKKKTSNRAAAKNVPATWVPAKVRRLPSGRIQVAIPAGSRVVVKKTTKRKRKPATARRRTGRKR